MRAIAIIDDITEEMFNENVSIKYEVITYPNHDTYAKEIGKTGKVHLISEDRFIDLVFPKLYDLVIQLTLYGTLFGTDTSNKVLGEEECTKQKI